MISCIKYYGFEMSLGERNINMIYTFDLSYLK